MQYHLFNKNELRPFSKPNCAHKTICTTRYELVCKLGHNQKSLHYIIQHMMYTGQLHTEHVYSHSKPSGIFLTSCKLYITFYQIKYTLIINKCDSQKEMFWQWSEAFRCVNMHLKDEDISNALRDCFFFAH